MVRKYILFCFIDHIEKNSSFWDIALFECPIGLWKEALLQVSSVSLRVARIKRFSLNITLFKKETSRSMSTIRFLPSLINQEYKLDTVGDGGSSWEKNIGKKCLSHGYDTNYCKKSATSSFVKKKFQFSIFVRLKLNVHSVWKQYLHKWEFSNKLCLIKL